MACIWPWVWALLSNWSPVCSHGWPLEWVPFNPIIVCLWAWALEGLLSRSKLLYTSDAGALTSFLSLGLCCHCLLLPDTLLRQGKLLLEQYGSVCPRREKKRKTLLNVIYSSPPLSNSIAIDATIQTNALIYSFWELLEKWIKPQVTWNTAVTCFNGPKNYILSKWNRISKGFIIVVKNSQPLQAHSSQGCSFE